MNGKFLVYALVVIALSTVTSWTRMVRSVANSGGSSNTGSSWSSTSHGGGNWGGGTSGGGHK